MLIRCQASKKASSMLTLFHLSMLLALSSSQLQQTTYTLRCDEQYGLLSIPIGSMATAVDGRGYQVRLDVKSKDRLALGMAVLHASFNISQFTKQSIYQYYHVKDGTVDVDSIQSNKEQQIVYYFPNANNTSINMCIFRINLANIAHLDNPDRNTQDNKYLECKSQTSYQITITEIPYHQNLPMNIGVLRPIYTSECINGIFHDSTSSCVCDGGYAMDACDTLFRRIEGVNVGVRNYLGAGMKDYYYWEPMPSDMDTITVQVQLTGDTSKQHTYSTDRQINILWCIQQQHTKPRICSMYNQQDPQQIKQIKLATNQRLVVTLYKPQYAVPQFYQIKIITNMQSNKDVFVIAIVCVSVSATLVATAVFILWVFYCKQSSLTSVNTAGLSMALPIYRNYINNKISNPYLTIDDFFPTVPYQQLTDSLRTNILLNQDIDKELSQKTSCSICLQVFHEQTLVRSTYCLHIFHQQCLSQWLYRQPSCPLCRQDYTSTSINKLELQLGLADMKLEPIDKYLKIWESQGRIHKSKTNQSVAKSRQIQIQENKIQSSQEINPITQR